MSGTPQNAANGQPFRVVTPPAYEPLHFGLEAGRQKGSEVGQTYSTVFMLRCNEHDNIIYLIIYTN